MAVKISESTDIDWVQLQEQAGDPAQPGAGYWRLYTKAGGLYYEEDDGTVVGPLSTGGGLDMLEIQVFN